MRPISQWPGAPTVDRRSSPFDSTFRQTVDLLDRELRHLGAEDVVLEIAVSESDLRLDGLPRASARPRHPGVILNFASPHGPLRYCVDTFTSWQANLRAVALGLESLRRVSRYGMGEHGEQYRGWLALPSSTEASGEVARGLALIEQHGSVRAALMATHEDRGGDRADFLAVQAARASLG